MNQFVTFVGWACLLALSIGGMSAAIAIAANCCKRALERLSGQLMPRHGRKLDVPLMHPDGGLASAPRLRSRFASSAHGLPAAKVSMPTACASSGGRRVHLRASAMSKGQRIAICIIGFSLAAGGVWLMLEDLSWKALAGLALILWGNNLSQSRVE